MGISIDLYVLSGNFSRNCMPVAIATPKPTRSANLPAYSKTQSTLDHFGEQNENNSNSRML